MIRESVIVSGVGGQGIQVASTLLCAAATARGWSACHYVILGSQIRGGLCECYSTISDSPVTSPPLFSACTGAIVMHPQSLPRGLEGRVLPGGLYLVNITLVNSTLVPDGQAQRDDYKVLQIPATSIARELGNVLAASMVAIGAYAAATELLEPEELARRLNEVLPPYRSALIELNRKAIAAGAAFVGTTTPGAAQPRA